MPSGDVLRLGEHTITVCNACRYCEGYCPVFPAMENRLTFSKGDLSYLANLCHNCGECLYACQYAPPHEFAINVPKTLAQIRLYSYEEYCWPRWLGAGFKRHGALTALALAVVAAGLMLACGLASDATRLWVAGANGDFYRVVPHRVMVVVFGGVSLFMLVALAVGVIRFWRDMNESLPGTSQAFAPVGQVIHSRVANVARALRDVLTLRHLHGGGIDCAHAEGARSPWRRWFHHLTFYGFMLCFASTSVAALYHVGFGWRAPYPYLSVPVVLGTAGGVGLLVGPIGLFGLRRRRDPALADSAQGGLDVSFIALLLLTSFSGLLLLVLRERAAMGALLLVHLGFVLALFVTLPYGKFVHGIYRTVALIKYAFESS